MSRRRNTKDPHAQREASNYDNPIVSREHLIELIEKTPLTLVDIAESLGYDDDASFALKKRLRAMERDGQILRNRNKTYVVVSKLDLVKGRVLGHRDGYGFFAPEDGSEDLYLTAKQMQRVFDGDEVLVRASDKDFRGRTEATIIEVIAHNTSKVVGRYSEDKRRPFVVPDNAKISQDVFIADNSPMRANAGQHVVVELTQQPGPRQNPEGIIVEVLGDHLAPGMETDVAIRSHGIPHEFSDAVLAEANALGDGVRPEDLAGRVDLRDLPLVTIDGEDARDFDDAVFCKPRRGGGWRLVVAIADVSHYVKVGSELDKEAFERGTSVYFPQRVVPMLPEALSNGLCSLKPQVDRLCLVCDMLISAEGHVTEYRFAEAVMHSAQRLTYTEVGAVLAGRENPNRKAMRDKHKKLIKPLENLHDLFMVLLEQRKLRGALEIDSSETQMLFNSEGKIAEIIPTARNDAHRLIEECMLAANTCAADFMQQEKISALYRVHPGPKPQKIAGLREFLSEIGLGLGGGEAPTAQDFYRLLSDVSERSDSRVLQTMVLRTMNQASYQSENQGHFGLAYEAYAHFTSPIRRYPDLLIHRAIRSVIRSKKRSKRVSRVDDTPLMKLSAIYPYTPADIVQAGETCSLYERRADDASRDVVAWLKCQYLLDKVGEKYQGLVVAVTGFGLFVELQDLYIEGLVHVTALDNDYYQFDAAKQRLLGENSRRAYQLGDTLEVQVVKVDLEERKVDLALVKGKGIKREKPSVKAKKKPAGGRGPRRRKAGRK